MEITEEQAEALVHQGSCRAARELGVENVRLAIKGTCVFCDLARMLKINQPHLTGWIDKSG